jgi:hypothetical protein
MGRDGDGDGDNAPGGERFGARGLGGQKDLRHGGGREHRDGGEEVEGLLDLDRGRKELGRVGQTMEHLRVPSPF